MLTSLTLFMLGQLNLVYAGQLNLGYAGHVYQRCSSLLTGRNHAVRFTCFGGHKTDIKNCSQLIVISFK